MPRKTLKLPTAKPADADEASPLSARTPGRKPVRSGSKLLAERRRSEGPAPKPAAPKTERSESDRPPRPPREGDRNGSRSERPRSERNAGATGRDGTKAGFRKPAGDASGRAADRSERKPGPRADRPEGAERKPGPRTDRPAGPRSDRPDRAGSADRKPDPRSERPEYKTDRWSERSEGADRKPGPRTDRPAGPRSDRPDRAGSADRKPGARGEGPEYKTGRWSERPERSEREAAPRTERAGRAGTADGGKPRTAPRTDRFERDDRPSGPRTERKPGQSAERRTGPGGERKAAPPRTERTERGPRPWNERDERRPAAEELPRSLARAQGDELPRLSKLMSERGICSRREADEWIENGWVRVDGRIVSELGSRVSPKAQIEVDQAARKYQSEAVTILIHKPVGYVSGQAEDGYQPASVLILPENRWTEDRMPQRLKPAHLRRLAPAGRLDIDSTGLLVLTQDGRIARKLIGEDSTVEKEYLVRVEGQLSPEGLELLNHGLSLDGVALKPAHVSWQNEDQLRFVLREGKKRQIRRMCELVGLTVVGLKRIRIGSVTLGKLPVGQWRYLRPDEKF